MPDGRVSGSFGAHEACWRIEEGVLCFADAGGIIHTRLSWRSTERIRLVLIGYHHEDPAAILRLERRGGSFDPPPRLAALRVVTRNDVAGLGLSPARLARLVEGEHDPHGPVSDRRCQVMPGTHPGIATYIASAFEAARFPYTAILGGGVVEDISGIGTARCVATLTRADWGELPFHHLVFYSRFESEQGLVWWSITDAGNGRVLLVYLPDAAVAVAGEAGFPEDLARILVRELEIAQELAPRERPGAPAVVAVIDMSDNHGHQLVNTLPAAERLLTSGALAHVNECWVVGGEFFGPIEAIFPEFTGRVRRIASRWQVAAVLAERPVLAFGIGSSCGQPLLIARLRQAARLAAPQPVLDPRPDVTLAFTLRASGRVCVNLVEVVVACVAALQPHYRRIRVLLDGWVLPESIVVAGSAPLALAQHSYHRENVLLECALATEIINALPQGVLVRSLVGETMLTSISVLQDADAYVAHVGTLQHKLSFLSGAPGMMHGPREQLLNLEAGAYSCAVGLAPELAEADWVEDIDGQAGRGSRFSDYRIIRPDLMAEALLRLVRTTASAPG
jgi:hypothetical protein